MKSWKILAAILLAVPVCLTAQEDNSAGCIISSRHTYVKISGNKRIFTDSVEMTVLDRRGEAFTSFEFQYSKGDRFAVNYAYVYDGRGNMVRKLKNSEIRKSQDNYDGIAFYDDESIKYFTLRHDSYPYRVSYSVTYTYPRFMHVGYIAPEDRCDIADGRYTVEVPAGYPLKILSRNLDEPEKTSGNGTDIYTWKYKYEYRKPETNASPLSDTDPYLLVLPEKFQYGVPGSYESWEDFGGWSWALNEGRDKLPDMEKARIDGMLTGVEDKREKVRILYHYLQDYNRYINVSIKLGGFRSHPAEYVYRNRFGDCKALSNYMRAMLEYAGIESYYTLAYSDRRIPRFDEDFPNNAFNHIIVAVPLEDETLFLECTSKNYPVGYYGSGNQGRKALVTKPSGSRLVDVPAMAPAQTECIYDFRVECPDERNSTIKLDAKLRGMEFEGYVSLSAGLNKNDAEIYLRNYIFGGGMQMTKYRIDRPHRDSTFVELHMEAANSGIYRVFGNVMVIDNFTFPMPVYELPENRKSAVQIDIPRNDRLTVRYRFGEVRPGTTPDDISIESPYGRYSTTFEIEDGGQCLKVTKKLEINAGTIPLEEYGEFYNFVSRARNQEHSKYSIPMP